MSQHPRIVLVAAQQGPWSTLADALRTEGADVLVIPHDATEDLLPAGWVPNGLVTLPSRHQQARFDQIDLDLWDAAAGQELDQRFHIAQLVARRMLAGDGGAMVHLVAEAGMPGVAGQGSAASLSYAVAGLSRGIALDLKGQIRSNVLAVPQDLGSVAGMILHLCGPLGQEISGQIISMTDTQLQLFAQSRPLRVAHCDGGWDEASLAAQARSWADYLPRLGGQEEAQP